MKTERSKKNICINCVIYLLLDVCIGYLFIRGMKYQQVVGDEIVVRPDGYIYIISAIFVVVATALFTYKLDLVNHLSKLPGLLKKVIKNKKTYINLLIIIGALPIAYLLEKVVYQAVFNPYQCFGIYLTIVFIALSIANYKYWIENIHILFFIIAMSVGFFNIFGSTMSLGSVWDDETHFYKAAKISWLNTGYISTYDRETHEAYVDAIMDENRFSKEQRKYYLKKLDEKSEEYPVLSECDKISGPTLISYVPAAVGMVIGRALFNNYALAFVLGKIMNLLVYSIAFAFAIKNLKKRGSVILSIFGLIPTSIYMASTYSYDWWVISITILGYSFFLRDLEEEGKVRLKTLIIALVICVLGILPKAVYFPLLFPMMILPNKRYEKPLISRILVVVAMGILFSSFMLPRFFGGYGSGDSRGGEEVNATEQVKYIINNPGSYATTFLTVLKTYITFGNISEYLTFFAYYGFGSYSTLVLVLLVIAVVIDNSKQEDNALLGAIIKAGTIISALGAFLLVATSMYISFTAVGLNEINGCQPRYVLPILSILMLQLGSMNIDVPKNKKTIYCMSAMILLALVFILSFNDMVLVKY